MNSAVIKYLFVQTLASLLRESYREALKYRLQWRQRLVRYSRAIKAAEFTLKDFVIETLMGLVEMDDFEEFRKAHIEGIKNDSTPISDTSQVESNPSHSKELRTASGFKFRMKLKFKRMLRKVLLPMIEKHEKEKLQRKKHTGLTTNSSENRYRSEWSP